MYGHESWTIKKAEHWKNDAFELWCCKGLSKVPWITRRSNQSILKKINPEYSLEGLMLNWSSNTLATWCEEQTHWKWLWCWERSTAKGEGDDRGWDGWIALLSQWTWVWAQHRWLNGHEFEQTLGDGEGQGRLACYSPWSQRVGHDWVTEQQQCIPGHSSSQNRVVQSNSKKAAGSPPSHHTRSAPHAKGQLSQSVVKTTGGQWSVDTAWGGSGPWVARLGK